MDSFKQAQVCDEFNFEPTLHLVTFPVLNSEPETTFITYSIKGKTEKTRIGVNETSYKRPLGDTVINTNPNNVFMVWFLNRYLSANRSI